VNADEPKYYGHLDGLFGDRVTGWCCREGDDRPLTLQLLVNDEVVTTFVADVERGDLAALGLRSLQHGFMSPAMLRNTSPDAIITVKVAGTNVSVPHSGHRHGDYKQLATPPIQPGVSVPNLIPADTEFIGIPSSVFPEAASVSAFRASRFANFVLEPPGRMRMPEHRMVNRPAGDYRIRVPLDVSCDRRFPASLAFPKMTITTLENAYCLPFAPPMLLGERKIITDFLIPWAREQAVWFNHAGGNVYRMNVDVNTDNIHHDIDTGFYMDHSISGHFGHFIGDCLCRMHAWEVARQIFGDVKLIIGRRNQLDYQDELFRAAGATAKDVIKFNGLIRCKRLLLATQSLGLEQYASPTSARLWSEIRDRVAKRDISLPDRIYLTRAAMPLRRLVNESDVERLFERHGFTVVRPDLLTIPQQIALVSNALLIAGPGGSGMFNVAFQGRMRSAFILSREHRLHLTEMLCCAGRSSDIWYHLGKDWPSEDPTADAASWRVDPDRLDSDVADWIAASVG
jgi:hypothetical protein